MIKIIVFFCAFLVCVKSEMRFEVQYFENNITIQEVYYSDKYNDNIDYFDYFDENKIAISISKSDYFECIINSEFIVKYTSNGGDVSPVEYIKHINPKKQIFDLYDCFKHLYPYMRLFCNGKDLQPHLTTHESIILYNPIHSFIERFYLYTQLEQINQKIKKYQINMNDLF
jgi:hypothetical protein